MPSALIVDDDTSTLMLLANVLERKGFATRTAASLAEARQNLEPLPDVCMIDMQLPDGKGTDLLDSGLARETDVVVITGYASLESSIEALRYGVRDYLTKPLTSSAIDSVLARFGSPRRSAEGPRAGTRPIVGESPEMKRVLRTLARIGPSEATVLIIGESGTGKELIAARLHELSPRSRGRYLALNCGAVSPNLIESELFGHEKGSFTGAARQHAGYFERAHGGTLFLDEITEMPLDLQVRLLRVLESRRVSRVGSSETIPVNVRVIAATNRDPREAVRQRKCRPFASGPATCAFSRNTSSTSSIAMPGCPRALRPRPSPVSSNTTGPATFASCTTSSSAPTS
jgi:two-component system, NtrC family, response regulator HydG